MGNCLSVFNHRNPIGNKNLLLCDFCLFLSLCIKCIIIQYQPNKKSHVITHHLFDEYGTLTEMLHVVQKQELIVG